MELQSETSKPLNVVRQRDGFCSNWMSYDSLSYDGWILSYRKSLVFHHLIRLLMENRNSILNPSATLKRNWWTPAMLPAKRAFSPTPKRRNKNVIQLIRPCFWDVEIWNETRRLSSQVPLESSPFDAYILSAWYSLKTWVTSYIYSMYCMKYTIFPALNSATMSVYRSRSQRRLQSRPAEL